jgi:DNA-binding winged helix-turn-helix (wHTH) protein
LNPTEINAGKLRKKALAHYELGKLRWELGDYHSSVPTLVRASQLYNELGDHRYALKALNLCVRMFAELDDLESLRRLRAQLHDLVSRARLDLGAGTFYTLALAAQYTDDLPAALEHLERALASALLSDEKEEMCYAIFGLASVYWQSGRIDDALRELGNLRVFFQVMHFPDLAVCSQTLHGYILVHQKQCDEAIELFWNAIDNTRDKKNLFTYVNLLYAMARAHADCGDVEHAKPYVRLAQRMTCPRNFVRLSRQIEDLSERVSTKAFGHFDLVLDAASNSVIERRKGRVDFKNQFILLDLLKTFLRSPGHVYSKEELVRAVWRQDYDPSVHDNKIYVTIKRLRQLIEPDIDKPKYIYRAKNGYYLNRNTRTAIQ